jgi:hypothetical protein
MPLIYTSDHNVSQFISEPLTCVEKAVGEIVLETGMKILPAQVNSFMDEYFPKNKTIFENAKEIAGKYGGTGTIRIAFQQGRMVII